MNPNSTARALLLVALVALVIGALAIALAPSSHHGHDSTVSAASRASRTFERRHPGPVVALAARVRRMPPPITGAPTVRYRGGP